MALGVDVSDAMLVAAAAMLIVAAGLLGRGAQSTQAAEIASVGILTASQARLVADGLPLEQARAIPDECAKRCTFTIEREFPLVCDCPGGP